jgi:hypothetical protein
MNSEDSMVNEYANSEAVMYAIRQADIQSAKRRKMLSMDPYDFEEVSYKDKIFRMRKSEDRPMYEYSTWGRMLLNPRTRDPGDRRGGVLFRLRFLEECESSYSQLNKQLVTHFAYKHSINDVKWLKKKCVQD